MRWCKKSNRKSRGFSHAWENEAGYVLTWVLILTLVASLVIAPFLVFMMTGMRSSYSYADTMALFYAADSGVEDAIHKLQSEFSATTTLDSNIGSGDTTIAVDNTVLFPEGGVIQIEAELIHYTGKTDTEFTGCTRGYGGTTAKSHDNGTAVTADLPDSDIVGTQWEYAIEDINGKQVEITIESTWTLEGLESDHNGTMPHQELVVVGQILDIPATALSAYIDENATTIPVGSTELFPPASGDDLSIIRIEDELIQYIDKTGAPNPSFTVAPGGRGYGDTDAATHDPLTAVTSEEVTYRVDITYDNSAGNLKIDKVGAWLPVGFSYVPGSSNVATTLRLGIFKTANEIPVESIDYFPDVDVDNPGIAVIEHEFIQYTGKQGGGNPKLTGCTRGYGGTDAADHLTPGIPVSAEPEQAGHHGGTALWWAFHNIDFEDLPRAFPAGGGSQPKDEFPIKRTVTFSFSPAKEPRGIFSWVRTNSTDIYLSWDTSGGCFKITSTATDPSSGTHTTIESYIGMSRLTGRVAEVQGNARAIGNSLMQDQGGDSMVRETLLPYSEAEVDDIPDDATVEAAYLYWSGWKLGPAYTGTDDNIQQLSELVDNAEFNGAPIAADRVQILENSYGWSFSCFKDVTDMLEPEQSATITINPRSTTESATITNQYQWSDADIRISADSGNPGDMTVAVDGDVYTISPGHHQDIDIVGYLDAAMLSAGGAEGEYKATIEVRDTWDIASVDGGGVDDYWIYGSGYGGQPNSVGVTVNSTQSYPEATITRIATSAQVTITATSIPDGGQIIVDWVTGDTTLDEDGDSVTRLLLDNPITLTGSTFETYQIQITCTDGMVNVDYDSSSIALGEPGSQMTNGEYTVGNVEADAGQEWTSSGEWAYAGWALIIIYSSPSEQAHQLFLYDDFTYVDNDADNFPDGYLEFSIGGFLAPDPFEDGVLTCFVGEGDDYYDDDYIEFNGSKLPRPGDTYDGVNPQDDVWNGKSSGLSGEPIDGVDIDTFDVSSLITPGDSSALLKLDTHNDSWNIVFIFLSFNTISSQERGGSPVGITTFSLVGG